MSRLVVVSNRVPSLSDGKCTGGLAVALDATLKDHGGIWFGWSGELRKGAGAEPRSIPADGFSLATIDLSAEDFEGYYAQHANRAVWPLLHGRVDLSRFNREHYTRYREVNQRFAAGLESLLGEDDVIWIHDYHLIPLGAELKRRGVEGPIGFFLHTPFPPPEIIASLPRFHDLLSELAEYDLVGFQTANSMQNYRDAIAKHLGGTAVRNAVRVNGHMSLTGCYPIGIDTAAFAEMADSQTVRNLAERLRGCMRDQEWVVGVERLDYTKGLAERFAAFETLLDGTPGLQGRISLIQVAAPSRETVAEYRDMQARLDSLSGRINARLGGLEWTPIRYLNRAFSQTQLAALYRVSKVGLVTPLRDGMNLVAKEYVAAQDPLDPGVLVLSRFAGAAEELTSAVLVNPHDTAGMALALERALEMPLEERRVRWRKMMQHLLRHDVRHWSRRFLDDMCSLKPEPSMTEAASRIRPVRGRRLFGGKATPQPPIRVSSSSVCLEAKDGRVKTA